MKLNAGVSCHKQHSPKTGFKFMGSSKLIHLEDSFGWCSNSRHFATVDHEYLQSFEMWCWRRMEKIRWTDRMKMNKLHVVKEEINILQNKTKES
jgi:hypothetical protein